MSRIPKPHEIYKHFKGNLYQIMAVAEHSETSEQLVIYQALYGEFKIYARPLENFLEKVDTNKYPDVGQTFRFELRVFQTKESPVINKESNIDKEDSEEIDNIDPMVMQFLDADTYGERLNILVGLRHRITDQMITTMAIACDVEVPQGNLEERFTGLKNCLVTLDKFEGNRLR
ncbi:MAG TPA: DUF1653 domain-containing protein [Lachnospiraceae bacterium]|nr:DUF1653 domain-containing protein [Lachnospiraceae bacterium]